MVCKKPEQKKWNTHEQGPLAHTTLDQREQTPQLVYLSYKPPIRMVTKWGGDVTGAAAVEPRQSYSGVTKVSTQPHICIFPTHYPYTWKLCRYASYIANPIQIAFPGY